MRIRYRRMREGTAQERLQEAQGRPGIVRRLQLRQVIFWLHLVTGIIAGLVIVVMSITGVLLAFERQILESAERHLRTVQPPASGAPRLDLDAILAKARAAEPEGRPSGVTLRAGATEAVLVNFGRERAVFVDPLQRRRAERRRTNMARLFSRRDGLASLARHGRRQPRPRTGHYGGL